MVMRIGIALLMICSVAPGKPATRPATRPLPATRGLPEVRIAPATTAPSAAELMARIEAVKAARKGLAQVAYIDLNRPIAERPADFALFSDPALTLVSVLERLRMAQDDKDLRGVLLTVGQTDFNLAQAQEIRAALVALRNAGKRTFVYADSYDTTAYIMASGATDICILGGGGIMMPGVGVHAMFYRGLLDKIGVRADYVQVGEYKGADEAYTRTEASKELKGELKKLVDSVYDQIVDGIAFHRNIARSRVEDLVDDALVSAAVARQRGLVDHLLDVDGLRDLLAKELGKPVELAHDYGLPKREGVDWSNPLAIFTLLSRKPEPPTKPSIALIYAQGVIVDGEGEEGLLGGSSVGAEDLRKAFRVAARDETIKGIVLRIDSPGGSALASEAIWQAARRAAREKPMVVSIGGVAASGGYYIAAAAPRIVADPSAIVGSIGVVGGKLVFQELFQKHLNLTTESFTRGRNADLFSSTQPFSDSQRRLITTWMKQTYDQFTSRVMETRSTKIRDIDRVARGRIFLARQAMELGMVDQLGGIQDCIEMVATQVGMERGDYEVRVVPTPKTLIDLLRGDDPEAHMPLGPQLKLADLPLLKGRNRTVTRMAGQLLQSLSLLERHPVILAAPYALNVR